MLASFPASMVNQKPTDLGIPNRFKLNSSRFRVAAFPLLTHFSTIGPPSPPAGFSSLHVLPFQATLPAA